MGIADNTESNILKLIYQAVAWTAIAQNHASTPDTNTAVALHTADPGDAGAMNTTEANYTSYARAAVLRTTGGWTVTGPSPTECKPVAAISFPAGTGGSGTVTHWSTGKTGAAGSAADIFFSGIVTPNIVTGNGVTPQLTTLSTISLE